MLELQTNIWINPEQICSIQRQSNKITGEVRIFIRMSNGEVYDIEDFKGEMMKKVLKALK